jgi:hypothetical protein
MSSTEGNTHTTDVPQAPNDTPWNCHSHKFRLSVSDQHEQNKQEGTIMASNVLIWDTKLRRVLGYIAVHWPRLTKTEKRHVPI